MPDFINSVQTQDDYVDALTFPPAPWTKQITFSVLAAISGGVAEPVLATWAKYATNADGTPNLGQEPIWETFERLYVGNTIGAISNLWAGGVKFRSAVAGSPAVIVAERDFQTDIIIESGNVSAASISPTGQTGGTGSMITGIIPAAGTIPTAGTGFTYTHAATGVYVFTFNTAYAATPVILAVMADLGIGFLTITAQSATGFTVKTFNQSAVVADRAFNFTAQAVV